MLFLNRLLLKIVDLDPAERDYILETIWVWDSFQSSNVHLALR